MPRVTWHAPKHDAGVLQRLPLRVLGLHRATYAAGLCGGIPPGHLIKAHVFCLIHIPGLIKPPATPLHGQGSNLRLDEALGFGAEGKTSRSPGNGGAGHGPTSSSQRNDPGVCHFATGVGERFVAASRDDGASRGRCLTVMVLRAHRLPRCVSA